MSNLQKQILALFKEYEPDVQEVVASVLMFEQENIHLKHPRFKEPILDVLDRVARDTLKEASDEN